MKLLFILSIPLLLLSACSTREQTDDPVRQKNRAVAQQLFTHFNAHEWKAMAELYADTALFLDPSLGTMPVPQSRGQIEEKYSQLRSVIPDIRDEVLTLDAADSGRVIVQFISTGTQPDGVRMNLPICTVFTIENGKIVKDYTYYDN